jgi:hypothetical protein
MKKLYFATALLLVTIGTRAQQMPNSGFETWNNLFGLEYPDGYITSDFISMGTSVTKSTDMHGGQFAAQLQTTVQMDTLVVQDSVGNPIDTVIQDNSTIGFILSGGVDMVTLTPWFGTAFTGKPDLMRVWAKTDVVPGDTAMVSFYLTKHFPGVDTATVVGGGVVLLTGTSGWTMYEAPIQYVDNSIPDTAYVQAFSSIGMGTPGNSMIIIDDFSLVYNSVGIENVNLLSANVYPNPTSGTVNVSGNGLNGCTLTVTDVTGRVISQNVLGDDNARLDLQGAGIYMVTAADANGTVVLRKKVTVQ